MVTKTKPVKKSGETELRVLETDSPPQDAPEEQPENEKTNEYYVSLLQRYFLSPTSLSEAEVLELRASKYLDSLSSDLENFKIKHVSPQEANDLKRSEANIQECFKQIGQLEFEKQLLLRAAMSMEEKKTSFMNELAIKYKIPQGVNYVVDINTGEIKLQEE